MFRLRTVRAKLTLLVALSVVVMVATLPVLSLILERQLIDEVDDRVVEAEKSFRSELEDDIADLVLAARLIASSPVTREALAAGDAVKARKQAALFIDVYPDVDILLADAKGHVIASVGCTAPPTELGGLGALGRVLAGAEVRTVLEHGCEGGAAGPVPPAFVVALPIEGGGAVLVCMPLDKELVTNAAVKLGLELAITSPTESALLVATPRFPVSGAPRTHGQAPLVSHDGTRFAIARFSVKELTGAKGAYDVIAALDVGDIEALVRKNLLFAIGVLAVSAAVSVALGTRVASVMSGALARMNTALKRLEQQEYVHVDPVNTGDELEDLALGFNQMVDGLKERDKLRTTMGKYMTAAVMDHLLSGRVALGGETLQVTILFSDIRSFTSISETMDAQALVALLNEYFSEMVTIVMSEDGVVDKYIGDAIMAVFGAPVSRPDDALRAVRAAVHMRRALAELNRRLVARGAKPIATGIGIHTGEVVAGNIGSEKRMEYTVIGDAVNLASRLEGSTKEVGASILISEDTYQLVKGRIATRPVREITVKGRAQPVMTYEVLGIEGEWMLDEAAAE